MIFPQHKASLHLTHNDHTTSYQTVTEWWKFQIECCNADVDDWVNPEQLAKAIETNEVWELQWYPDTPVGFIVRYACDLDVLLEACKDIT